MTHFGNNSCSTVTTLFAACPGCQVACRATIGAEEEAGEEAEEEAGVAGEDDLEAEEVAEVAGEEAMAGV